MEKIVATPSGDRLWTEALGDPRNPPILLIMGANASALGWPDEFVALLVARSLYVLRYDHRDTGRSTHRDVTHHPYSLEDMAGDAVAVLDGHDVTRAHVVGMSLGGTLGQLLAIDHGHRLCSLTLMATAALDVDFAESMRHALEGGARPDGLPTPTPEVVRAMSVRTDPAPDRETALRRRVQEWRLLSGNVLPFDAEEFRRWEQRAMEHAGSFRQPGNHALAAPVPIARGGELRRATTPTLVVEGPQDPINPPPHGRRLAELLPMGRCLCIPGLGHALPGVVHRTLSDAIGDHVRQASCCDWPVR